MRSHTYEFSLLDLARLVLPTLGVVALYAVALHAMAWLGWLPRRPITLRADETVLRHQARASRSQHPAEIVLIGDSTCHTAIDAAELSRLLPQPTRAINLALVINIEFSQYAQIAADFAAANPDQVRWVVLLITPLRLANRGESTLWQTLGDDVRTGGSPGPLKTSRARACFGSGCSGCSCPSPCVVGERKRSDLPPNWIAT
jgi:hypothetical protein